MKAQATSAPKPSLSTAVTGLCLVVIASLAPTACEQLSILEAAMACRDVCCPDELRSSEPVGEPARDEPALASRVRRIGP